MEPTQQTETQNSRIGLIALLAMLALSPVALAVWFWAWSLTFAAWHLMTAQFTGF